MSISGSAHQIANISTNGGAIWTDDPNVTLQLSYDHFSSQQIEMYVSGGDIAGTDTFKWIPFQSTLDITLEPKDGTRVVFKNFETELRKLRVMQPLALER